MIMTKIKIIIRKVNSVMTMPNINEKAWLNISGSIFQTLNSA